MPRKGRSETPRLHRWHLQRSAGCPCLALVLAPLAGPVRGDVGPVQRLRVPGPQAGRGRGRGTDTQRYVVGATGVSAEFQTAPFWASWPVIAITFRLRNVTSSYSPDICE